jgi:hypothetical protein
MQLAQARGSQSLLAFSGPTTVAAARTRLDKGHRARSRSRMPMPMPMPMPILPFAAARAAAPLVALLDTGTSELRYLVGRDPERLPSGQLLETRPLSWRSAGHPRHQPSPRFNSRPRPESRAEAGRRQRRRARQLQTSPPLYFDVWPRQRRERLRAVPSCCLSTERQAAHDFERGLSRCEWTRCVWVGPRSRAPYQQKRHPEADLQETPRVSGLWTFHTNTVRHSTCHAHGYACIRSIRRSYFRRQSCRYLPRRGCHRRTDALGIAENNGKLVLDCLSLHFPLYLKFYNMM